MDSHVSRTPTDVSPPPRPQPWQTLQVDFFGGLGLQPPRDPLVNLHLSFPSLLLCPPAPGRGCQSGPRVCAGGGGDLIFPIVQRTTFVKNVNNRLLYLGLVSGGGGPFPPKTLAVYFACCICNPLVVVAFFFFLRDIPIWEGEAGRGNQMERERRGQRKGAAAGDQTDRWRGRGEEEVPWDERTSPWTWEQPGACRAHSGYTDGWARLAWCQAG